MRTKSFFGAAAALFCVASGTVFAQSNDGVYRLTDLTQEQFAQNPAGDLWQFEKYSLDSGRYSLFTQFSDSNAANYVDIYQPCRVGGERVVQIDGLTDWANDNTFASVTRWGWSDYRKYSEGGTRTDSKGRFCYVTRDEILGYEVYANDAFASVISFIVPKDGFYEMTATMVRQDVPAGVGRLCVVPRFRYGSAADMDYAHPQVEMCELPFGQEGGEVDHYDGNAHIANGATQRYVAQQAEEVTMAFEGREGDIVSFEVNASCTGVHSDWARDFYGRAFFRQLNLALVEESVARGNAHFTDTYGESGDLQTLLDLIDECDTFLPEVEFGDGMGQYNQDLADQVAELAASIYEVIDKGQVHAFNAASYLEELQALWAKFLASKVEIDLKAEGNYALFYTDLATGEMVYQPEVMAMNNNQPWGFYYYEVANGLYHPFENHSTSSKYGSAEIQAWYKGTGDWLYIADNGSLHPMTNYAPAIMFTAPEEGVYKVNFGCYRPNPNKSVENPLWIRARFMNAETMVQDKDSYMFAKEFGSVANDGQGGMAPISMEYFVNMKKGDKITWELDCYTSNRNSSAGTDITTLTVCAGINADKPYTLENIAESGIEVFDAYSTGDPTEVNMAIANARQTLSEHQNQLGCEGGQYSAELYAQLSDEMAAAQSLATNGGTQYNMDQAVLRLNALVQAFLDSRAPYEIFIEGAYAIQLKDTEKYLTQKNKNASGANYYAAFADYAGVLGDATKNSAGVEEYNWTFTFRKITKQEVVGYDESTGLDITVPVEQLSIFGKGGYLTGDGYVMDSPHESLAPAFRFFKYNLEDEEFAILNADGGYWSNSFSWKNPYDKVNTTAEPNYIFVLSDKTLVQTHDEVTAVDNIQVAENVIVSTEYYSLSGVKLAEPQKGVNVRRQTMSDGRVVITKVWMPL